MTLVHKRRRSSAVILKSGISGPKRKPALSELKPLIFEHGSSATCGEERIQLKSARAVSQFVKDMHEFPKECLRGLYVDTHLRLLHDEIISVGTIDSTLVHARDVFRPAISAGAAAVILVHNHPSGVVVASQGDIEATQNLVEAGRIIGIPLVDHIVVGKGIYATVPVIYE